MKILILFIILLFSITLSVEAISFQQDDFYLTGSPQEGWIFLTPQYDYFAKWFNQELWAVWFDRETRVNECLIIRNGNTENCPLREFSILLYYYPFEEIKKLRI